MGNRKNHDPMTTAALEVVKREREEDELKKKEQELKEKNIAFTGEMVGTIKAMNFMRSLSEITVLMRLRDFKEGKSYSSAGMTWDEACEAMGLKRRTVDENLAKLEPFRNDFLANFASFFSNDFRKIKYLGLAVSGESAEIRDGAIVFQGETIPVTPDHADDIQALLEKLEEDYKTQIFDKDSEIKAQKRIASSKEDVIKKMEKEIKRLEHTVDMTDLTPEEAEAFDLLAEVQKNMIAGITTIKQKIKYNDTSSPAVLRQLYFLYIFASKLYMDERMILHENYRDAEEVPWEITEEELPPTHVLIDNMPGTTGMGKAYKEKMAKRKRK